MCIGKCVIDGHIPELELLVSNNALEVMNSSIFSLRNFEIFLPISAGTVSHSSRLTTVSKIYESIMRIVA